MLWQVSGGPILKRWWMPNTGGLCSQEAAGGKVIYLNTENLGIMYLPEVIKL